MSSERVVVFDGLCRISSGRALLVKHGIDPDNAMTYLVLDGGKAIPATCPERSQRGGM